jgi:hypothetical protein
MQLLKSQTCNLTIEETRGLVVRQKTHDREVLGSNPPTGGDHFSCTTGTVTCAVILQMGGWTLWMVDIYICTKAINVLWVDS